MCYQHIEVHPEKNIMTVDVKYHTAAIASGGREGGARPGREVCCNLVQAERVRRRWRRRHEPRAVVCCGLRRLFYWGTQGVWIATQDGSACGNRGYSDRRDRSPFRGQLRYYGRSGYCAAWHRASPGTPACRCGARDLPLFKRNAQQRRRQPHPRLIRIVFHEHRTDIPGW